MQEIVDADDESSAAYNAAVLLWADDRWQAALAYFSYAAELGDADAVLALGRSRLWLGDVEGAVSALRPLAASDSTLSDLAAGYLGRALLRERAVDEAVAHLKRACAADPEFVVDLADALVKLGDNEQAESVLTRASDEGNRFAPLSLGNLHEEAGRLEEAELAFRRGIELGDAYSEYNLARLLWVEGRNTEAMTWLRSAAQKGDRLAIQKLAELGVDHEAPST